MKYKKVSNNENAIEIDGKVVLSFDPRYKKYLKWRDKNPELEERLIDNLEQEIENKKLYNLGAPHKEVGIWKWYNEKGQLILRSKISPDEEEIQEVDGLFEGTTGEVPKSGLFIGYYESGKKKSERILRNGKEDGLCTIWYDNGQLNLICEMKNGKKDGIEKGFYDNGEVRSVIHYKNGKKHGKLEFYHQSVRKGKEVKKYGKTSWFFIEPDKEVKETDENIVHEKTSWFFIEPDKDLLSRSNRIETWKDGKPYGEYIDYHLNSKERAKGNMLYGMMDGKWTFWYNNGKKELEVNLDFGSPIDSAKVWHDNGVLKEELKF